MRAYRSVIAGENDVGFELDAPFESTAEVAFESTFDVTLE
jgi:hypothetical protein